MWKCLDETTVLSTGSQLSRQGSQLPFWLYHVLVATMVPIPRHMDELVFVLPVEKLKALSA